MDRFFRVTSCDRCSNKLVSRTMSWFTEETICNECSIKESELKSKLRNNGDTTNYEGCGYVPSVRNI